MSPSVTYWTGIWEPSREALSKEVEVLRRGFARRPRVVSFSTGQRSSPVVRDGVLRLSSRAWPVLRVVAAIWEPRSDVGHLVGDMGSWHMLRALGRRPLVFTVAIPGIAPEEDQHKKVDLFAAESEPLAAALVRAGIDSDRIRIIYPGVDLTEYSPGPLAGTRFRVLFASSPAQADEFERRGVPLMVEAARQLPDVEFLLLWRQWGDRSTADRAFADLRPPTNLRVLQQDVTDMAAMYRSAHCTAWLGAENFGKSSPNSVIEGLACGRPAITSTACGLAGLLEASGAGIACRRSVPDLVAAVRRLRLDFGAYGRGARALAEKAFDVRLFALSYRSIYRELAERGRTGRRQPQPRAVCRNLVTRSETPAS